MSESYVYENYVHRVDLNSHKAAMGVHPVSGNIPFPSIEAQGTFYRIEGKYWQFSYSGSDDQGIFFVFHKIKGTFVAPEAE